jgi:hypothetical protein
MAAGTVAGFWEAEPFWGTLVGCNDAVPFWLLPSNVMTTEL